MKSLDLTLDLIALVLGTMIMWIYCFMLIPFCLFSRTLSLHVKSIAEFNQELIHAFERKHNL